MPKILILHGPNLNILGERETSIYGKETLTQINQRLRKFAATYNRGKKEKIVIRTYQSNHEGKLIDWIHKNRKWATGMVFNPGAYTHYSYALRDAVSAMQFPTVEVHLSDIRRREKFRRRSVIAPACLKQISGLGWRSYLEGIKELI
jgi:3-dehydroquinate dehydratase II